jgi:hypothetical protein
MRRRVATVVARVLPMENSARGYVNTARNV